MQMNKSCSKNKKDDGDYLTTVLCVQIAVCFIVGIIAFAFVKIKPDCYEQLKEEFSYIMNKDITIEKAVDAFKEAVGFAVSPASVWTDEVEKEETTLGESQDYQFYGEGGEDLYVAQADTSFAPVFVTQKAYYPIENGTVTSGFGYRIHPIYKTFGFHTGMDIATEENSPIHCIFDGKVIEVGENETRGKYIVLEHSSGMVMRYFHCSEIIATLGANIRRGEVIARVGTTGLSTGPHLHLEVLIKGIRYNPVYFIGEK
ncbi:MAG: M23 family metallopeptidase [Clostridiales bacterium]|nr:M23 family metallopeptidase [Clostridiales bacterium]